VVSKVSNAATSASRLSKLSVTIAIITPTIFTNVLWLQESLSAKNMLTCIPKRMVGSMWT
jgi:hypothetical protein